jgi:hypothetical protein
VGWEEHGLEIGKREMHEKHLKMSTESVEEGAITTIEKAE